MQSVTEAWTHGADPTFCLLSEDQLKSLREEGVNKVMKEMINKYLIPANNTGIKKVVVKPDEHYFDKIVSLQDEFTYRPKQREKLQRSCKNSIETGCQNTIQRSILTFSTRRCLMKCCLRSLLMYKL